MRRLALIALAGIAACVSATTGGSLGAPSSLDPRRDERVRISSFVDIVGVAATQRTVFAVSPTEIAFYDRQFNTWQPPVPLRFANPGALQLAIVAADPIEDAAWIAMAGSVRFVRSAFDMSEGAIVPGVPDALFFDQRNPAGGAYVHSGGDWFLVSRVGLASPVVGAMLPPPGSRLAPPTAREVAEKYPNIRGFAALLTRDETLTSWPISSAAVVPGTNEVWLGTRGGGLFKVDPNFNQSQHVPYGLPQRGAGAVAVSGDEIVVAPYADATGRGGLTVASRDLQRFRWIEGPNARALAGVRARDIATVNGAAWLATDRGLVRVQLDRATDVRLWSAGNGLPTDVALSIAADRNGVWVGTARGLAFVRDSGRGAAASAVSNDVTGGASVRALAVVGDTLWIGTDRGLELMIGASPDSLAHRPAAARTEPRLDRPIAALAQSDSVLLVATDDALLRIDARTGRAMPALDAVNIVALQGVTSAAMDGRAIWLTGRRGVLVVDRATGASRLLAGSDFAYGAEQVRLDGDVAWIATRDGLVRQRRTAGGLAP